MVELPVEIYTAEQARELDRAAIAFPGISAYELMRRAGDAALACVQRHWPGIGRLSIFCGAGNNAGDGYVLARLAAAAGIEVRVIAVTAPERLTGPAALGWGDFQAVGGKVESLDGELSFSDDLIVDGLVGTGLDRDLGGSYLKAVMTINAAPNPVLALDIPTGLHADTGVPMGSAVHADITITFVGLKAGLFLGLAPDYRGVLEFSGIGTSSEAYAQQTHTLERLSLWALREALPPRRPSSHKGTHGSLLLVGGSPGMVGAILLAAEAALRAGAGLVRVATHSDSTAAIVSARPEIMTQGIDQPADLDSLIEAADAVVLGPGLGQSEWARGLMERVLASELPVVLDADGLNLLAEHPRQRDNWILTPHPGEAARLMQCDVAAIQADRRQAVLDIVDRYEASVVLKGADSLIGSPGSGRVAICDRGNPGMATAGMGDILAGIIGALRVQTGDNLVALRCGVLLHALAGDSAVTDGQRGLLARDLMSHIRRWANPA
jgi:hydroxyethylthiazole kinase-like uncharacterized protein yjeF